MFAQLGRYCQLVCSSDAHGHVGSVLSLITQDQYLTYVYIFVCRFIIAQGKYIFELLRQFFQKLQSHFVIMLVNRHDRLVA